MNNETEDRGYLETPHGRPIPDRAIDRALSPNERPEDTAEEGSWLERPHGRRVSESTIVRAMKAKDKVKVEKPQTLNILVTAPEAEEEPVEDRRRAEDVPQSMRDDAAYITLAEAINSIGERALHNSKMITRLIWTSIALGVLVLGSFAF